MVTDTLMLSGPQVIQEIVHRQKAGQPVGIYSVCSANRFVIQAAMRQAIVDDSCLLIEATCNQVNPFGGYTGLTPQGFAAMIYGIASEMHFPGERILLGGDHLGPFPWQNIPAEQAMSNAMEMVQAYIRAGFCKIHLDTSMPCLDDAPGSLSDPQLVAERAARLCQAAEVTAAVVPHLNSPLYVIGSEVPTPGGTSEAGGGLQITDPTTAFKSLMAFKKAFGQLSLEKAWDRVIALVVQPGVEYGDEELCEYNRQTAMSLSKFIEQVPGLVFEAHSTDYQQPELLKAMVTDHFAILKVGPALTFAFREAVFALARMEAEWLAKRKDIRLSHLIETILSAMREQPAFWKKYYQGTTHQVRFACQYSRSDRIRYYWNNKQVERAIQQLFRNLLQNPLPRTLLSQYMPTQYRHLQSGVIANNPHDLICDHIMEVLQDYSAACGNESRNRLTSKERDRRWPLPLQPDRKGQRLTSGAQPHPELPTNG